MSSIGLGRRIVMPTLAFASLSTAAFAQGVWTGYGGNAQHTAQSAYAAQNLNRIIWQTPIDTNPTYSGNDLLIHYGEPVITAASTILIPVHHGSAGFSVDAHKVLDGHLLWSIQSGYVLPPYYDWVPSFGPTLVSGPSVVATAVRESTPGASSGSLVQNTINPLTSKVAWPESGGRVAIRSNPDLPAGPLITHAFYGDAAYAASPATFNANVQICTPLTSGPDGSIYFGYNVSGSTPNNLQGGLAVIRPNGTGSYISAQALVGSDPSINQVQFNCAPALSADGTKVYIAVSAGYWAHGYLVSASTSNLAPVAHVLLTDPLDGSMASVVSDGTSSPLVAPDGTVFMGVLENTFASNDDRGYMLHFSGNLQIAYTPGAFGWDDTGSICPSKLVPSYKGTSSYLVMTKYNNYADFTGAGDNLVALVDPTATMPNDDLLNSSNPVPFNNVTVMKVVASQLGQTKDSSFPNIPTAVHEWCINSAAVDLVTGSIIVNSEDGFLYRWNLKTNTLSQKIQLTGGIGEAYTPTLIAPTGQVFAINNATLFCVGN